MPADVKHKIAHSSPLRLDRQLAASKGNFLSPLIVIDMACCMLIAEARRASQDIIC